MNHTEESPLFEETWRWFGPQDPVSLADIRQTGATGIVTALHHLPNGTVWSKDEIAQRMAFINTAGLRWSVVESVPVHEDIKTNPGQATRYIQNYQETLHHLAQSGIKTVCYNFMPVLDWTRTHLDYALPSGATALRFDAQAWAAFDLYILQRPKAPLDYSETQQKQAQQFLETQDESQVQTLIANILAGLPGSEEGYDLHTFREKLALYRHIDAELLRKNLIYFLEKIAPVAQNLGIQLALHPDDPPFPLLGLPRVVSTERDANVLLQAVNLPANGLCFCTGSYGARPDNDLPGMVQRLGNRIHFVHLRNVNRETDGSFYEAEHLNGQVDMYAVLRALIILQIKRQLLSPSYPALPYRPDHGHKMLDDLKKKTNPGYSAIGRLRGLAELRGLALGIQRNLG